MNVEIIKGLLIPFLGTSLGAACVFFMKNSLKTSIQRILQGFAAGIMVAAAVWSLLIPAIDELKIYGETFVYSSSIRIFIRCFFLAFIR